VNGPSQWPRGLRHKLSSTAQMLGVVGSNSSRGTDDCECFYSVFVLSCAQAEAL
jgi:hypothetical protein